MTLARRPFVVAALVLVAVAFALEAGSRFWILADTRDAFVPDGAPRPGFGIPSLAALDALLLLTTTLFALVTLGIPAPTVGRVQGLATVIVSFLGALGTVLLFFATLGALMLMIGLLVSVPFGTAIYIGLFGGFPRGTAAATLALLMAVKLAAAFCLVIGTMQVLKSKSTVLLFLSSIGLTFLVVFLHAFVPRPIVSISDAIAALVALVLAFLWAIYYFIAGVRSILKNI